MRLNFLEKQVFILRQLGFKAFLDLVKSRLYSLNHYYALKMNLRHLKPLKPARLMCTVSEATKGDFRELKSLVKTVESKDKKDLLYQLRFYEFGFRHCYVVRNQEQQMIALHWLIYPSENSLLKLHAAYRLPQLKDSQVIVDNVFIFPKFRAYSLLAFLTSHLLHHAKKEGYKTAITVTNKKQLSVLNTLIPMGFRTLALKTELRFLGLTKTIRD